LDLSQFFLRADVFFLFCWPAILSITKRGGGGKFLIAIYHSQRNKSSVTSTLIPFPVWFCKNHSENLGFLNEMSGLLQWASERIEIRFQMLSQLALAVIFLLQILSAKPQIHIIGLYETLQALKLLALMPSCKRTGETLQWPVDFYLIVP